MRFSYVIVWLPYLLIGFFNIGVPVVRTYGGDSPLLPYPPHTNVDVPPPSNGPSRQIMNYEMVM